MSQIVTLELPDALARSVRTVAERTNRPIEDVVVEWLGHLADDTPLAKLPDEQIVALCEMEMSDRQQQELSDLLSGQREGMLGREKARLDQLLAVYRRGTVDKARALKIAVDRGSIPPLGKL